MPYSPDFRSDERAHGLNRTKMSNLRTSAVSRIQYNLANRNFSSSDCNYPYIQTQQKHTKGDKNLSSTTGIFLLVHWFPTFIASTPHSLTLPYLPHLVFFWWSNRHAELTSLIVSLEGLGTGNNVDRTPAGSREERRKPTVLLT